MKARIERRPCLCCPGFNPGQPPNLTIYGVCDACFARLTHTRPPAVVDDVPHTCDERCRPCRECWQQRGVTICREKCHHGAPAPNHPHAAIDFHE